MKTKEINQEKIFKFLWPDNCPHFWVFHSTNIYQCSKCEEFSGGRPNDPTSLTSPDGMVMILDRLVEMGYGYHTGGSKQSGHWCKIFYPTVEEPIKESAPTAPLAVLNAVQALMEKEEER